MGDKDRTGMGQQEGGKGMREGGREIWRECWGGRRREGGGR